MPRANAYTHHKKSVDQHSTLDNKKLPFPPPEETDFQTRHFSDSQTTSISGAIRDEKVHTSEISVPEVQRPPKVDRAVNHFGFLESALDRSLAVRLSVALQARNTLRAKSDLDTFMGKGHHILRVFASEELVPLTSRTGKSFVDSWLDAVICAPHFVLSRLVFQWSLIMSFSF